LAIGPFDSFSAVKMKAYYQALYHLPLVLPLTSRMPSRQPIRYYRLLLAGKPAEPDEGNAAYEALCDGWETGDGKALLTIADEGDEDPAAILDVVEEGDVPTDSDVDVPIVKVLIAPKAKRRKVDKPSVGGGGGSGAASSGGGDAPAPPAPVGHPVDDFCPTPPGSDSDVDIKCPGGGGGDDGDLDHESESDVDILVPVPVAEPVVARGVRPDRPRWFSGWKGFMFRYDASYVVPKTGATFSANLQVQCQDPAHGKHCVKTKKNMIAVSDAYGEIEALCFLCAWTNTPKADGKTHVNTPVPKEAVDAVYVAHAGELQGLLDEGRARDAARTEDVGT
jgi:hypothetical protein